MYTREKQFEMKKCIEKDQKIGDVLAKMMSFINKNPLLWMSQSNKQRLN